MTESNNNKPSEVQPEVRCWQYFPMTKYQPKKKPLRLISNPLTPCFMVQKINYIQAKCVAATCVST